VQRELCWGAALVVVWLAGPLTVPDGPSGPLVWSGGGVVVLWLAAATRRTLRADLATAVPLVAATELLSTGWEVTTALLLAAHVVEVGLLVAALRRVCGHLYGFGGTRAMATPREGLLLGGVGIAGASVGWSLGWAGLVASGADLEAVGLLATLVRNAAGMLIVLVVGTLVGRRFAELRGWVPWASYRHPWRSWLEPVALWVGSSTVAWTVFGPFGEAPLGYLLFAAVVLVAARLGPIGAMCHTTVMGGVAIVSTATGQGPFAAIADLASRDLAVHTFGLVLLTTSMLVCFSRHDRALVGARLERLQQRTAAEARDTLSVLEQLQEGLTVVREGGEVVLSNAAGARLLGTDDGGPGPVLRHLDGTLVDDEEDPFRRAASGERFQQDLLLERDGDGALVLEVTGAPVTGGPGREARGVVTYRDVTAMRHDRDALAEFAGVVAHDLKRPLTTIVGWTRLLAEGVRAGDVDRVAWGRMVDRISSSADHMTRLLDDLLLYTVVRDAPVRHEVLDVTALGEQSAELFRAREARPEITVEPGLEAVADPVLLRQVLDNLVGNATKYVAPGVRPRIHVGGHQDGGASVLTVRDNGTGIPPEMRERVFEVFQRAHGEGYRGTGLGLAIVRRALERCDGTVSVRDPGPDDAYPDGTTSLTGTVFEVRLPAPVHAGAASLAALLPTDEQL